MMGCPWVYLVERPNKHMTLKNRIVISSQGSNGTNQFRIEHDSYIRRLFKLCETIHKHGACIAIQINHTGASLRG